MAMTLRLDEQTNEALRKRAAAEGHSMQEVVKLAVIEYIDRHGRQERLDRVLDEGLPRYGDALRRLGE
jgi:predicted transcriptional regulator